ncbi:nitrite reductase small subunit NirD [Paenibacillus sp. 7523-1]|uniref:nitrite reductase small subunit NirD n=1 Tax=Paenibacillus sp. 7523-1 TaxID=2022550 RepID=UPI000BA52A40|nr:nitrite reductase small subunit NirD [Paenibacillus sp. 7523-1]PAD30879.1 nitrite reductase (NAD(P)H) small subunit [Paenibacillus sp. 7523-1]
MTTKQSATYFPAGEIEEFLPRIGRVVEIEGRQLAVFRASDGTVFAADNHNPHPKGGPLAEGIISGHYLYDPLYDWKIDLSSGQVQAPDQGQVQMFPVKLENGQVWIAV